jgi:hypothetical protein
VITDDYLQEKISDISVGLSFEGFITLGTLASRYQLPLDIITDLVKGNIGDKIQGILKVLRSHFLIALFP